VDEAALTQALRECWIAGAALDVFASEPLPPDHPLLQMDNVILAPHPGSFTREAMLWMLMQTAEQVSMVFHGQCLPNLVNATAWENRRQLL
jgi:phosphoglycerate dehydrogenase-like enzyme